MQELARLGLFISCLLAIYVGARTLAIWRRTLMLPELAIGTNVIGIAMGGALLTAMAAIAARTGEPTPPAWLAPGLFCLVVHIVAQNIGNWKIFRPTDRWPVPVVALASLLALAWMVSTLIDSEPSVMRSVGFLLLRLFGMGWAAWECFRYAKGLRKRAALGLGDPMVAHRIWLWGIGASAQCLQIGLDLCWWTASGQSFSSSAAGLHLTSLLALLGASCVALAFFPPRAYVDVVSRSAAVQAS